MEMERINELSEKTNVEDTDLLLLGEESTVLKKITFTDFLSNVKNKFVNWGFSNLTTQDQTVVGAINELNQEIQYLGNLIEKRNLVAYGSAVLDLEGFEGTGNLTMDCVSRYAGVRYDVQRYYEPNAKYRLSFWVRKDSGTCTGFGMHNGKSATFTKVSIDGTECSTSLTSGNEGLTTVINSSNEYHFVVIEYTMPGEIPADSGTAYMYVQPNRTEAATGSYSFLNLTLHRIL